MAVPQEKFVIGNWKMNLLVKDSVELASGIKEHVANLEGVNNGAVQAWIAPSYLSVPAVVHAVRGSAINVGSQNICGVEKGAFTGEISASMLKDIGATFSLIGHSERRSVFEESNKQIALRVKGSVAQGITPVFCIGENLTERESGKTNEVLLNQLEAVLPTLNEDETKKIIIAYEPVWAIGTGKTATTAMIHETHQFILESIATLGAKKIRGLLYGGSVTPDNFSEILAVPGVHGGLVGGASLKVESFLALVKAAL